MLHKPLSLAVLASVVLACESKSDMPAPAPQASVRPAAVAPAASSATPTGSLRSTLGKRMSKGEHGGPQSRMLRGGDLELIEYAYAPGVTFPPVNLPPSIQIGVVKDSVDDVLEIKPAGEGEFGNAKVGMEKVPLYEPIYMTDAGPQNLCAGQDFEFKGVPPGLLKGKAIAVPGHWDYGGEFREDDGKGHKTFTLSCAPGVIAKCIVRGYVPWSKDKAKSSRFSTCLYASRFQPAPGQKPETCNNKIVDIYDEIGIQERDDNLGAQYTVEGAWNERLLCWSHPRYSGCEKNLAGIPKCPQDIEKLWSLPIEGKDVPILLKTRSVMVNADCPDEKANVDEVCDPKK